MKKYQTLVCSQSNEDPRVLIVQLNRPRKRNAINAVMWKEIGHLFQSLQRGEPILLHPTTNTTNPQKHQDVRCILLTGSKDCFCAGIDISDSSFGLLPTPSLTSTSRNRSSSPDVARRALTFAPQIQEMQNAFSALEQCLIPVVAAIQGPCIGAGVDLICCTDIRLCSPGATFAIREVCLGLAADVGTLQRLPKMVGNASLVSELALTGCNFNATLAAKLGLISRVAPTKEQLLPMAMQVCKCIASRSPVAVVGTKRALLFARDHTVRDGLEQIAWHNAAALMTDDVGHSMAAAVARKRQGGGEEEVVEYAPLLPASRL